MKWELKHFGLELYTTERLKQKCKIEVKFPATFGEDKKNAFADKELPQSAVVRFGLLDNALNGPKNISTFETHLGYIKLETPLIRPECKDDILSILEEEWPDADISYDKRGWPFYKDKEFEADERDAVIHVNEILDVLKKYPARRIKGNEFIQHNTVALPETMIINVLPVPSVLARPTDLQLLTHEQSSKLRPFNDEKMQYRENDLTLKLSDILRINIRIKENKSSGAPQIILDDLAELLQYHITTYLDNRTLGIPPARGVNGEELVTIAQLLGKDMGDYYKENLEINTKVDSSIKRIVRCINSGERVIYFDGGGIDELSIELAKQCALKKIFSNLIWDDVVTCYQINSAGECSKMNIDVLENDELVPWDFYSEIPKSKIIHAYKDAKIIDFKIPSIFPQILDKLRRQDYYIYTEREKIDYEIAKAIYSIIEKQTLERNSPSIIIIDNESINSNAILEKAFGILENNVLLNRLEVAIIIRGNYENRKSMYTRGHFTYNPTDNSLRYSLIALNQIKRMKEFENHLGNIIEWENSTNYNSEIKRLSFLVKCLNYPEIKRLIGQVIQAEGTIKLDTLKEYIKEVLKNKMDKINYTSQKLLLKQLNALNDEDYKLIKPIEKLQKERSENYKRKRTTRQEEATKAMEDAKFADKMKARAKKEEKLMLEETNNLAKEKGPHYEDLKGLDPLVTWCKRKGRLFSEEAKEFGFDGYPKGVLLTGLPGCGKTMTAKAISNEWNMPFMRYQPDAFISSVVGGSEEKLRLILDELEENAPCICFVDEAEKIFGQTKATELYRTPDASRDAVESMLLQFIEENEVGVFFIFTANDYVKLSPALVDRFDERFFIGLPSKESRGQIIKATLTNNKQDLTNVNIEKLAKSCNGFTGRDIRSAISEAMMIAFEQKRKITEKDLIAAFKVTAPTSIIHKENIRQMKKLVEEGKMRMGNTHIKNEKGNDENFTGWE